MSDAVAEASPVAAKLEALRARAAVRSVDVANMLGTTPETVSRWKHGRAYPRPNKESLLVRPADLIQEGRAQEVLDAIEAMASPPDT